jgi:hypothetical protein
MEESLSHNMGYTPGIFDNIFRWHFVLEIDISMIILVWKISIYGKECVKLE